MPRWITRRRFKAYLFRNDCDVARHNAEGLRYSQACMLNNNAIRYVPICRRQDSPQPTPKETSGNTDFCYYVADRIAPRHTRFIYACTDTPICISTSSAAGYARAVWIFIPRRYYISVDQVYLSYRVIIATASIIMPHAVTGAIKFISPERKSRSTVVLDRSDLIVIIVTRVSQACDTAWPPRKLQSLSGVPLRRQYSYLA